MSTDTKFALTNFSIFTLFSLLEEQCKGGLVTAFYSRIIRSWLNSVPLAVSPPFEEQARPFDDKICRFGDTSLGYTGTYVLSHLGLGCHTIGFHNLSIVATKTLHEKDIRQVMLSFPDNLWNSLLTNIGKKSHVFMSDNFLVPARRSLSELTDRGKKLDNLVWGIRKDKNTWPEGCPFFTTADFMQWLESRCTEDPGKFGKVYTTEYSVNANYNKGLCKSLVWLTPICNPTARLTIEYPSVQEAVLASLTPEMVEVPPPPVIPPAPPIPSPAEYYLDTVLPELQQGVVEVDIVHNDETNRPVRKKKGVKPIKVILPGDVIGPADLTDLSDVAM